MPAFGHVAQSLLVLLKRVTHRLTDACQLWLSVFADLKATRIREASEKAVQIRNFMLFFFCYEYDCFEKYDSPLQILKFCFDQFCKVLF